VYRYQLVIKPKVVKEALQWISERRAQVQSYVNQTELTSEVNLQKSCFTLVERHFRSKNDWLWKKPLTCTWT